MEESTAKLRLIINKTTAKDKNHDELDRKPKRLSKASGNDGDRVSLVGFVQRKCPHRR